MSPNSRRKQKESVPDSFGHVWDLIIKYSGQDTQPRFQTKRDLPLTYDLVDDYVIPSRTAWRIPKANFELYYDRGPVDGPGGILKDETLKKIQGPSYLWAIMHDERIRPKDWY